MTRNGARASHTLVEFEILERLEGGEGHDGGGAQGCLSPSAKHDGRHEALVVESVRP